MSVALRPWSLAALALAGALSGCGAASASANPERTLAAYSQALEAGHAQEAYGLLSDDAKKTIPFEQFQRMIRENPEEVRDIAKSLRRPTSAPPRVTATVTAPNGESVLLVYQNGAWRVDGSAV